MQDQIDYTLTMKWQLLILVLVVTGACIGSGVTAAQPTEQSVSIRIDGTQFSDDSSVVVTHDPRVKLSAVSDSAVDRVNISVDGEHRASLQLTADDTAVLRSLDLTDGTHTVQITATRNDSVVTTVSGTVLKDSAPPYVSYQSPIETNRRGLPNEIELTNATTTISGRLFDTTRVAVVRIDWEFEYTFGGGKGVARERYEIKSPTEQFSQPLTLGVGENEVVVTVEDEYGHIRQHETIINLRDSAAPSVQFNRIQRINNGSKVVVAGVIRDNVQVNTFRLEIGGQFTTADQRMVISRTTPEPSPERQVIRFNETFSISNQTTRVRYNISDTNQNFVENGRSLPSAEQVAPTLTIDTPVRPPSKDSVAVTGRISGGRVTRAYVSSANNTVTLSRQQIYDGPVTEHIEVDARVPVASSNTNITIGAIDTLGRVHTETVEVTARSPISPQKRTERRVSPSPEVVTSTVSQPTTATSARGEKDTEATAASGRGFSYDIMLVAVLLIIGILSRRQ